jgi:hypothetical protein
MDKKPYFCINVEIPGESKCKCKAENSDKEMSKIPTS